MNISTKIKEAVKWVLVFVTLNVLFCIIEQLVLFFIDFQSFLCFFNALCLLESFFFQCLLFLVITLLTVKWIDRKYYYFIFPITLFLLLSSVFLFNIHMEENEVFFVSYPTDFAIKYCFDYNANIILDILLFIKPLHGIFESTYLPYNTIYFYILYAVTPFVYYLGLTYLCNYIIKKKIVNKKLNIIKNGNI